jgi:seryl-tRNA synthetase
VIGYGVKYASEFIGKLIEKRKIEEANKALARDQAQRAAIQVRIDEINRQIAEIEDWLKKEKAKQESIKTSSLVAAVGSAALALFLINR